MAPHPHVWGGWANYDARRQYRRCLRCGKVEYRYYGTQPA